MLISVEQPRAFASVVARHPAVPVAAAFLAGIAGASHVAYHPGGFLLVSIVVVVAAILLRPTALAASALLTGGWLLLGVAGGQMAAFAYPADHIALFASDDPKLARLELRLDDPPRIVTNPFDERRAMPPKQTALATVVRVRTKAGWTTASGDVLLQISEPHPQLAAGQVIQVAGLLQRPAPAQNPGQFDWSTYYRERRVLASVSVGHPQSIRIVAATGPTWLTRARLKARSLLAMGFTPGQALDHALLRALVLGDNDPQLRDVQDQFQRTGTAHHLAISGTHVAVLGAIVWGVCRLLALRPRRSAIVALVFIAGYGALALPSPPVVRSVVLAAAMGVGLISGRRGQPLSLLAASVVAMLVYHPPDLFNAGFQLSFGTVLGLVLLGKPTLHALQTVSGYNDPDRVVKRKIEPPTLLRRLGDRLNRAILASLAAGLVAWFVSMPLIAYHFEQLNPWAILAGIGLSLFVVMALVAGLLKIVLTLAVPTAAGQWADLAAIPVRWMRAVVDWLASWPLADVPVPPSPAWLLALFYGLLLTALWRRKPDSLRWTFRLARVVVAAFIVVPPLQSAVAAPLTGDRTVVTLLSVGAGQCAVVQPPGGRTVLVDAGSSSLADLVGKCLGPYLRHARVTNVDTLVLSHADYDHVSAAAEVTRTYGVREILCGDRFDDLLDRDTQTRRLSGDLASLNRPPRIVLPGQRTPIGRTTAIDVLWPPAETVQELSTNDGSLVFRLTHAGHAVLFPGDIQDGAMRQLLKTPALLKADVLVAMHHGSAESLSAAFIAAVDPHTIIASNDRTLTAKQRQFDRLCIGRRLLRTNDCGAITLTLDSDEVKVQPYIQP